MGGFMGDGKSGPAGNSGGGAAMHRGPDRPQQSGTLRNENFTPAGGKITPEVVKVTGERASMVCGVEGVKQKPFKLNGDSVGTTLDAAANISDAGDVPDDS